jgi:hypothetical protein
MEQIFEYIRNFAGAYYAETIFVLALLFFISLILVILNVRRTSKIIRKYNRLMRGTDNKNLESMLFKQLDSVQSALTKIKDLELAQSELSSRLNRTAQHIGMIRYNAFDNIGSDQSFSIAVLNEYGDGFVLTSLYGRNMSTVFAKPIKGRKSSYPLTDEELEAIKRAFS